MELSFVTPGTQAHQYALKLAGLPEGTGLGATPVGPAWVNDTLTAVVRIFDAYRVHSAGTYFAYHAREAAWHLKRTTGKATIAHVAGDLHDDVLLLVDTSAIAQLVALISLETSGVVDAVDIHLVMGRLRDDALVPPAGDIDDVTFVLETGIGTQNAASRH